MFNLTLFYRLPSRTFFKFKLRIISLINPSCNSFPPLIVNYLQTKIKISINRLMITFLPLHIRPIIQILHRLPPIQNPVTPSRSPLFFTGIKLISPFIIFIRRHKVDSRFKKRWDPPKPHSIRQLFTLQNLKHFSLSKIISYFLIRQRDSKIHIALEN